MKDAQNEMMGAQMSRQLKMQGAMREKQMCFQVAMARQRFWYYQLFASGVAFGCIAGALKTKNAKLVAPLWPIGIGYSFQHDMAYGNLMDRARLEAEEILLQKPDWLQMPGGMPTVEELSK
ncbi:Oidioi.mRNA.OKI2018_I69.chr1.g1523.t1.cds [Oikopleura dioica]|uniref:Oidioi.mRNA.OKI2018_I69.chr1.g1523.t1.cds n=1 Tax=Oikopleura dioica TaxID=34765 RepID=A0ABN7SV63_OIKDI|nr:Oidioi.mRNA.OKI2018_I69.chr1.g1523.t1.cds [Oikopleura dioica]